MATKKEQPKTKEMKMYIWRRLRKGAACKLLIPEVEDKFGISYSEAYKVVYACNKVLKTAAEEVLKESATYIVNNLQSIVDDAMAADDRRSALQGLKQMAEIGKLTTNDTNITVNFGFQYTDE